jgi:hypothetical protein
VSATATPAEVTDMLTYISGKYLTPAQVEANMATFGVNGAVEDGSWYLDDGDTFASGPTA